MSILNETDLKVLEGMVVYWQEVFERGNADERERIMNAELAQVISMFGVKKVLLMIAEYVRGLG